MDFTLEEMQILVKAGLGVDDDALGNMSEADMKIMVDDPDAFRQLGFDPEKTKEECLEQAKQQLVEREQAAKAAEEVAKPVAENAPKEATKVAENTAGTVAKEVVTDEVDFITKQKIVQTYFPDTPVSSLTAETVEPYIEIARAQLKPEEYDKLYKEVYAETIANGVDKEVAKFAGKEATVGFKQFEDFCPHIMENEATRKLIERDGDKARSFFVKMQGVLDNPKAGQDIKNILAKPEGMAGMYEYLKGAQDKLEALTIKANEKNDEALFREIWKLQESAEGQLYIALSNDMNVASVEHWEQCYSMTNCKSPSTQIVKDFLGGEYAKEALQTLEKNYTGEDIDAVLKKRMVAHKNIVDGVNKNLSSTGASSTVKTVEKVSAEHQAMANEVMSKLEERLPNTGGGISPVAEVEKAGKLEAAKVENNLAKALEQRAADGAENVAETGAKVVANGAENVAETGAKVATKGAAATVKSTVANGAKTVAKKTGNALLKANAAYDRKFDQIVEKGSQKINNSKVGKAYNKAATAAGNSKAGKAVASGTKTVAKKVANTAVGKATAKVAAKAVGTTVGKSVLKKVPGVGLVAGAYFAYERAKKGDWIGAACDFASGACACFPGPGTWASVGFDMINAGRDVYNATTENNQLAQAVEKPVVKKQLTAEQKKEIAARGNVKNNTKTNTTAKKVELTPAQIKSMGEAHTA